MYAIETAWNNEAEFIGMDRMHFTRTVSTFTTFEDAYDSAEFRWYSLLQLQDNSPLRQFVPIQTSEVGYRTHVFDVIVVSKDDPTKIVTRLNVYIVNLDLEPIRSPAQPSQNSQTHSTLS